MCNVLKKFWDFEKIYNYSISKLYFWNELSTITWYNNTYSMGNITFSYFYYKK